MTTILVNGLRIDTDLQTATPDELRAAAGYTNDYDVYELGLLFRSKIKNKDRTYIIQGKEYKIIPKDAMLRR